MTSTAEWPIFAHVFILITGRNQPDVFLRQVRYTNEQAIYCIRMCSSSLKRAIKYIYSPSCRIVVYAIYGIDYGNLRT